MLLKYIWTVGQFPPSCSSFSLHLTVATPTTSNLLVGNGCKSYMSSFHLAFITMFASVFIYSCLSLPLPFTHWHSLSLTIPHSTASLPLQCNIYMHTYTCSLFLFPLLFSWLACCLSSLFLLCLGCCSLSPFLYLPVPGAMANHLITNALLRPHATNNLYNTLLGDSAVYNNPAVGMYNTQGVPDVSILN